MKMKSKKRVAFLLGAGASVAVGMPTTNAITEEILSLSRLEKTKILKRTKLNLNEPSYSEDNKYSYDKVGFVPEVLEFINRVKECAENYNTQTYPYNVTQRKPNAKLDDTGSFPDDIKKREINYEDLWFLISQIYDHVITNVNIFGSILDKIIMDSVLKERYNKAADETTFGDFIQKQVAQYIASSLIDILYEKQKSLNNRNINKLRVIVDAINDDDIKISNIFTLNHDTIVERLLSLNKIVFCDGFEKIHAESEIRKCNPELYDKKDRYSQIRIMKIHGSVDWRYFRRVNNEYLPHILGIYSGNSDIDSEYTIIKDETGNKYHLPYGKEILIGTENKIRAYLHVQYWDMFSRFRKYLTDEVDVVIVCGYSFGDTSVNGQLMEWLFNNDKRKLITINIDEKLSFEERLEQDVRRRFKNPRNNIVYIEKKIEKVKWHEIKSLL